VTGSTRDGSAYALLPPAVRTAALVGTAATTLWRYRVRARLVGASEAEASRVLQRWSRRAWDWLGLDVRVRGRMPEGSCIYVANHRSYLDIPVLAGAFGPAFMSRADVASWPVVGGAAREIGSVFVDRDDATSRIRAAFALRRRLRHGSVAVFPEGTTCGTPLPGPFHPGLFLFLHRAGLPVHPITVRYGDRRAYWTDDVSLGHHLRAQVLVGPRISVVVHVGPAIDTTVHRGGDDLARAAWAAIARPIEELGELAA
jgi:1-acyl-sn-glycerol-3-phosphate acyltransferase